MLRLDVDVRARDVSVGFEVAEGETVALLGPNGAGKSTVLAVIAGLIRPDRGQVRLAGRALDGVAPHRRNTALLAQDPLLFPHLTALENVAFGPRAKGGSRQAARSAGLAWLCAVGVAELAGRRPHQLSGGQAQRVAVARALAAEPQLLLLDEPMAALDAAVLPGLRQVLRTVLTDRTVVLVTHDALDALVLADRVIVLEHGRIAEAGPTRDVLTRPRSAFAARIAGLNLIGGRWDGAAVVHAATRLRGLAGEPPPAPGDEVVAVFSPTAVAVYSEPHAGSPRNVIAAAVTEIEPLGDRVRVRTRCHEIPVTADITPAAAAELDLASGSSVWLSVKATEVTVYPAAP